MAPLETKHHSADQAAEDGPEHERPIAEAEKCEADHDLGYALMKRFLPVLVQRLQATRLQILDVYGPPR